MQTLSGITGYPTLIAVFAVLFGLVFGSFASVLTVRIPAGKSIVYPDSACPKCGRWLPPWENVPLLSYLLLRGRCRGCGERIGLFYPLMEIGTAALYVLAVYAGGLTPVGLAYSGFAVITLPLLIIDLRHRRLPNVLTLAGFSWAILCAVIAAVLAQDAAGLLTPVLSAAGCAAFFLLLFQQAIYLTHTHVVVLGVIASTLGQLHKVLVLETHDDVIHHIVSRAVSEIAIFLEQVQVVNHVTQRDVQVLVKYHALTFLV